jgi:hypothetical protein
MSNLAAYVLPLLISAVLGVLGLLDNKALNAYVVAQQSLRMVNLSAILAVLLLFILVIWFLKSR